MPQPDRAPADGRRVADGSIRSARIGPFESLTDYAVAEDLIINIPTEGQVHLQVIRKGAESPDKAG
jgi:hypothetical protein